MLSTQFPFARAAWKCYLFWVQKRQKRSRENPVWTREWRSRWRRPITPIAIFGYAAILAVVAGAYFAANIAGTVATHDQTGVRGQELLIWLARVQMILASLFAAALSSPAIAAERHSGTLALLRLSPLSSHRIVGGKFASAALVVLMLILVPLPMNSIAFVLGGVSALDFAVVTLLQCGVVSLCAAGGIVSSGNAATTAKALSLSFFLCVAFLILPLVLLGGLNENGFIGTATIGALFAFFVARVLVASAAFQLDLESLDIAHELDARLMESPAPPEAMVSARVPATLASTSRKAEAPPKTKLVAKVSKRVETPLGKLLHFSNPLVERELRGRLRSLVETSPGGWPVTVIGLITLSGCGFLLSFLSALSVWQRDFYQSFDVGEIVALCVVMSAIAVMLATLWAAQSFAREREGQMLQALLLTTLSPRDIAGGKRDAALGASAILFLLALPSFVPLIALDPILGMGILGATLGFMALGASCGLLCAWLCQSPGIAVAGAFMLVLGFFGAFARVLDEIRVQSAAPNSWFMRQPFSDVLVRLAFPTTPDETALSIAVAITLMFAISVALSWPVLRGLRPAAIEKDGVSIMTRDLSQAL